jgi:hypothetical protein
VIIAYMLRSDRVSKPSQVTKATTYIRNKRCLLSRCVLYWGNRWHLGAREEVTPESHLRKGPLARLT